MKCPKCGYNSFDYLEACKKCGGDLTGFKTKFGLRSLFFPKKNLETSDPEQPESPHEDPAPSEAPPLQPASEGIDFGYDFMGEEEEEGGGEQQNDFLDTLLDGHSEDEVSQGEQPAGEMLSEPAGAPPLEAEAEQDAGSPVETLDFGHDFWNEDDQQGPAPVENRPDAGTAIEEFCESLLADQVEPKEEEATDHPPPEEADLEENPPGSVNEPFLDDFPLPSQESEGAGSGPTASQPEPLPDPPTEEDLAWYEAPPAASQDHAGESITDDELIDGEGFPDLSPGMEKEPSGRQESVDWTAFDETTQAVEEIAPLPAPPAAEESPSQDDPTSLPEEAVDEPADTESKAEAPKAFDYDIFGDEPIPFPTIELDPAAPEADASASSMAESLAAEKEELELAFNAQRGEELSLLPETGDAQGPDCLAEALPQEGDSPPSPSESIGIFESEAGETPSEESLQAPGEDLAESPSHDEDDEGPTPPPSETDGESSSPEAVTEEEEAAEARRREKTEAEDVRMATLTLRLWAGTVDLTVLCMAFALFITAGQAVLFPAAEGGLWPSAETLLDLSVPYFLVLFAVSFGYFTLFHFLTGQTVGKMLFRLRVEGESGGPLLLSQAFLHSVGGLLCLLPAGLGVFSVAFSREGRGWNDLLSGSRVVRISALAEAGFGVSAMEEGK